MTTLSRACRHFTILAGLALFLATFATIPHTVSAAGGVTDANVADKMSSASSASDHQALAKEAEK